MNTIKQISFMGLVIILVLSSCTMEKRVHRSGYYIEWHFANQKNKKCKVLRGENHKQVERGSITTAKQVTVIPKPTKNNTAVQDENILASVDNKAIILSKIAKNYFRTSLSEKFDADKQVKPKYKSKFKGIKTLPASPDDDAGMSGMALAGFICGTVGLLLMLATGWPFLLGTLGVIFSAVGLSETSKGKRGKGFAIAGLATGLLAIILFWILVVLIASFLI